MINQREILLVEARAGIEPTYKALQSRRVQFLNWLVLPILPSFQAVTSHFKGLTPVPIFGKGLRVSLHDYTGITHTPYSPHMALAHWCYSAVNCLATSQGFSVGQSDISLKPSLCSGVGRDERHRGVRR